ncbi:PadR family transcriptional regulator [Rhodococcus sp. IEGM 1241]|uniref:PadR family transcriptional regulator n=1 Tax=Rhodococcus TaxID=1827 RepID=UPI000BB324E8|nr:MULTISPECIES: PadR family transcriptional regulator [Rhodococcus]MDV8010643.1 PadR family transcriptional regulator [Rhodococcus sp. IEGM 1241]PBJ01518.1 Transcriptional regulator PadR-like family protein [Rhodococcus erythropolis]
MAKEEARPGLPSLRPTSWAVLGLLSFGSELSGYDLKKWADWSLRFFYWAPSFSQIYSELRNLESHGFATSRVVTTNDVKGKRLYKITEAGTAAVAQWANESPVEAVVLKHGVMLRMWLGHLGDPDKLQAVLTEHRDLSEKMRVRAVADAEGASEEPGWAYPELVLRWSEMYYESERDRADWMLENLARLATDKTSRGRTKRKKPVPRSPDSLRKHEG